MEFAMEKYTIIPSLVQVDEGLGQKLPQVHSDRHKTKLSDPFTWFYTTIYLTQLKYWLQCYWKCAVATCNIGHLDVNVPEDLPTWYGSSEMERAMVALGIQRTNTTRSHGTTAPYNFMWTNTTRSPAPYNFMCCLSSTRPLQISLF